ncbi:MAG: hypothetical protein QM426_02005 [Euryarchaeota archaeon]|nr:hypothetical protein [Euryarchaeota archaeon]
MPLVANSLSRTQVLGLTMDMRSYRSRQSAEKHRLYWYRTCKSSGVCGSYGIGLLLTGII